MTSDHESPYPWPVRPRVVVRFRDAVEFPWDDDVDGWLDQNTNGGWSAVKHAYPGVTFARVFKRTRHLKRLRADAKRLDESVHVPRWGNYMFLDPRGEEVDFDQLADMAGRWPQVEYAHVHRPGPAPFVRPTDDDEWVKQGHLDGHIASFRGFPNISPAHGVDVQYAWRFKGGDGNKMGFADVEAGWHTTHADLVGANIPAPVSGLEWDRPNHPVYDPKRHGTRVLGVVCGQDNSEGVVGMAPRLAKVRVSSWFEGLNDDDQPTANYYDAIVAASGSVDIGDVVLLELTVEKGAEKLEMPAEVEQTAWDAIRFATAAGRIVVEAAGNGGHNVDPHIAWWLNSSTGPTAANRDSHAILVGSARSYGDHVPDDTSNFGTRVDCWAWGDRVRTTSLQYTTDSEFQVTATDDAYHDFGATSGASAIIAGAAIAVQGMHKSEFGAPLLAWDDMRAKLAHVGRGIKTKIAGVEVTNHIGVMPNLRKIIDEDLALPFPFVRENVADIGLAFAPPTAQSPDIILKNAPVTDANGAFGPTSGTKNIMALSEVPVAGQPNHVYVRVHNRNNTPATNVVVDVYESPVFTAVVPYSWTHIGRTTVPLVPPQSFAVAPVLTWTPVSGPPKALHAVVGVGGELPESAANLMDTAHCSWVRKECRAVASRHFFPLFPHLRHVPVLKKDVIHFPFVLAGLPERRARMLIEFEPSRLRGALVGLEAPRDLIEEAYGLTGDVILIPSSERAIVLLRSSSSTTFGPWSAMAGAQIPVALIVQQPALLLAMRSAGVTIVQRLASTGEEVGRIHGYLGPRIGGVAFGPIVLPTP